MSDFIISCNSTADLEKEHLESRDIKYTYFHYFLDGKHYWDDLGQSMSFADFYKAMQDGADTKTSQINAAEYEEFFESFLKDGKDVLHLELSSGISGALNSSNIARDILQERYPDRKIYVVDSLNASVGYGLIVDKMADLRDEGKSIDEIYEWLEENKLKAQAWFFTTDLTFLVKGGRVSKASGFVGGVLNICPLLAIDAQGKLVARQKIRTKKKVIEALVKQLETYAENRLEYSGKIFISHSACYEDAKAVADKIEERFPNTKGKILINNIGTTIGSHTGPGTVAMFFWGDKRED